MDVNVNYLAVVLAGLSSMAVGAFWYSMSVMGKPWMEYSGLKMKDLEGGSPLPYVLTLVASTVTAYVLAHVAYLSNSFFGNSFLSDTLTTAFWLWLGFTAARMLTHSLFDKHNWRLIAINVSHEFVTIMVMAFIIGLMR